MRGALALALLLAVGCDFPKDSTARVLVEQKKPDPTPVPAPPPQPIGAVKIYGGGDRESCRVIGKSLHDCRSILVRQVFARTDCLLLIEHHVHAHYLYGSDYTFQEWIPKRDVIEWDWSVDPNDKGPGPSSPCAKVAK